MMLRDLYSKEIRMHKRLFILSTIFAVILVGIAFASYRFRGGQGEILPEDDATYNGYEYEPTPYPTPYEYEPYQYEEPEPYAYQPEYTPEPVYEGDTSSPWHPIHFREVREPHPLTSDTPHGYISVHHIQHLNDYYYLRFPFSYQEKLSAAWIVQELLAIGYTWDNIQVQEFDLYDVGRSSMYIGRWHDFGVIYHNYDYIRSTYLSQNVILTVPGQSSQVIVIGAHYDTVMYPGASDNASGTALLLESAQRMRHIDNYYTLVYVFFGAEEVGLLGAHYYVNNLTPAEKDNIIFMINADVLFEGPYFIFGGGYQDPAQWRVPRGNAITQQWEEIAGDLYTSQGLEIQSYPPGIFLSSDQRVFLDSGFTVMMLFGTDFHPSGDMYFRVLHSYRDCFHYIMDRWPDKIGDAMWTFSVFLEEVLLARY